MHRQRNPLSKAGAQQPFRGIAGARVSYRKQPGGWRVARHRARERVMRAWLGLSLVALVAVILLPSAGVAQPQDLMKRMRCLACHVGESQHHLDGKEHQSKSSTIAMPEFERGDHGKMLCADCHSKGFTTFPHRNMKTETCMDCHPRTEPKEAAADKPYDFERILKEFEATAHFTEFQDEKEKCCGTATGKVGATSGISVVSKRNRDMTAKQRFTCEHCHEPHYFQATARIKDPQAILKNDNGPCLHCHMDGSTVALKDPAKPNLVAAHAYMPYAELHLQGTRCVDCHSSVATKVAHDLPKGMKAHQGCNTCHSIDSVLLSRLYRYASAPEGTAAGFHNAGIMKDGYVMGANRNRWTDVAAYLFVTAGLVLVGAHGGWRILARRRKEGAEP